ncbi:SMI1/KNR4 family protein [Streptomyces sp. NPDC005811]|uniref:SMI1/KNR4 family protein n=1 Tax=Streptomyces sp. NPDC005811 TaxID=3154565 RepID=UPI0034026716
MWTELISSLSSDVDLADGPGCEEQMRVAEVVLGHPLPAALKEFWSAADGARDKYGTGIICSVGEVVDRNLEFRSSADFRELYMPFDPLLLFGESAGGDLFGFVVKPERPDVFVWEHESDSRRWVANNLEDYLRRRLGSGDPEWYASW